MANNVGIQKFFLRQKPTKIIKGIRIFIEKSIKKHQVKATAKQIQNRPKTIDA